MHPQRAFTLLELLVVLSLIGLIAGVIAPRFSDFGDKLTLKNTQLEVRQKINGLPLLALRSASQLRIDDQGAPAELPSNWRATANPPIVYRSNGSCLGGQVEIWQGKIKRANAHLQPPFCQWPR
jgi:general secretion pathway protein G